MAAFRTVVLYAPPGVAAFGLGAVSEVFADRSSRGLPAFDLVVCTDQPGPVRMDAGWTVDVERGPEAIERADLVLVLAGEDVDREPSGHVLRALGRAHEREAIVASCCVGAFALAAAGLLDGRRATTHWRFAASLARRYPTVTVDPKVLYVDEGRILTGAGVAASIDLSLYLVRREHGAAAANAIARDMVVPPHRDGGQAQYVEGSLPADSGDSRVSGTTEWALQNLHRQLTVDVLARRSLMSRRSFVRQFKAATGTTPHAWVVAERLRRSEELLETTDLSIEEVASRSGFGTAAALREQFIRRRGVPPRTYRRTFGSTAALR